MAPLPRAYQWADGSAYVNHVELVRKARGATMPPEFWTDPLMYQGGVRPHARAARGHRAAPTRPGASTSRPRSRSITGDVPMGTSAADALGHIRLLMLVNDVSLRNLIPAELAKGFGFFQSKPASAFSPVAVTPDELGDAWRDGKVHLPLVSHLNGALFGRPNAGVDMTFDFGDADRARREDARRSSPAASSARARSRTRRTTARAGRRRTAASAIPASPSSASSRRSWPASRRRRSCASATACASRCSTRGRPLDLRRDRPAAEAAVATCCGARTGRSAGTWPVVSSPPARIRAGFRAVRQLLLEGVTRGVQNPLRTYGMRCIRQRGAPPRTR